ncbi:HlyD family type I secretion periplasmic adaptor subunit [Aeromonas salmonicida]|uniref:HlyD family type I secretion periplasmic adaptor subunit n=1 Tax=Aeromonas salmonicida TaxID=645 RepID=UPI00283A99C9|nr:HlyD family type I secretion periplasmic adaptor subunit [Aeromonas salmonicida]
MNLRTWLNRWRRPGPARQQETHYGFLPAHLALAETPPSPFARITALTLSAGVLLTLLWACWGQLDIQATASGRLLVFGRSQMIQSYEQARVITIHVEDGQAVAANAPLLTLNTLGVSQDLSRLREQQAFQYQTLTRYQALYGNETVTQHPDYARLTSAQQQALAENHQSELHEYRSTLNNLQAELGVNQANQAARRGDMASLTILLANIRPRLLARQTLSQSQAISRVEYLEQEKELLETQRQLAQQRAELKVLQSQQQSLQERLAGFKAQKQREWIEKRQQAQLQLTAIEQELAKLSEREHLEVIRAPVAGTVQQLAIHTQGAVVQPAQQLLVIVPNEGVQYAEVKILNKDIGFVHEGQTVSIKVDAFPYTRYGTIDGELVSVSRDATTDEQLGLVFPARVKLSRGEMQIDNQPVRLTPGMSVVAEVKTDRRRVIDYLLSPIREYQAEALRER